MFSQLPPMPPGYRRSKPPERPKLGPLAPVIDAILEADRAAFHLSAGEHVAPQVGDVVEYDHVRFEVIAVEGHGVRETIATKLSEADDR